MLRIPQTGDEIPYRENTTFNKHVKQKKTQIPSNTNKHKVLEILMISGTRMLQDSTPTQAMFKTKNQRSGTLPTSLPTSVLDFKKTILKGTPPKFQVIGRR